MNIIKLFPFVIILMIFSCSDNEAKTEEKSKKSVNDSSLRMSQRLSKDNKPNIPVSSEDSAKVLTYSQLQSYMPVIPGYTKGLTGGETLSNATSGGRQSYARQEYDSQNGKIIVEIIDYSLVPQTLKDLMGMYERNATVKNEAVTLKTEKVNEKNVTAISEINNTDSFPSLKVNVEGRYFLNINGAKKMNVSSLIKIAESINLKKLKKERS